MAIGGAGQRGPRAHGAPESDGAGGMTVAWPDVSAMIDLSLSQALDNVCLELLKAHEQGAHPRTLRLHPHVYDLVASARTGDVARGNPLLLFGLQLVSDRDVELEFPEVR